MAEIFLWKTEAEADEMANDPARRTAIADEFADVTIYALLLAHHYGVDLGEAVVDKTEKNEATRPLGVATYTVVPHLPEDYRADLSRPEQIAERHRASAAPASADRKTGAVTGGHAPWIAAHLMKAHLVKTDRSLSIPTSNTLPRPLPAGADRDEFI